MVEYDIGKILGKILVLHGLTKLELNNTFIGIDGFKINENNFLNFLRYKCISLEDPNLKEVSLSTYSCKLGRI